MRREPRIIAFCCNWCGYAAADLAGTRRLSYPEGVRIIRVMCSGMVHPELVLHALEKGADGVMIIGCHRGQCHYIDGNEKAMLRAELIEELMEDLGHDPGRFVITRIAAGEPEQFVRSLTALTDQLRRLDPAGPGDEKT